MEQRKKKITFNYKVKDKAFNYKVKDKATEWHTSFRSITKDENTNLKIYRE